MITSNRPQPADLIDKLGHGHPVSGTAVQAAVAHEQVDQLEAE